MEVVFERNTVIQKLTDDLIDKLILISHLSGKEAAFEFTQGLELIQGIADNLKRMTGVNEINLMNGIRQLIEQRLPGEIAIQDLSEFSQLIDDLLKTGLDQSLTLRSPQHSPIVISLPNTPVYNSMLPSSRIALETSKIIQLNSFGSLESISNIKAKAIEKDHKENKLEDHSGKDPIEDVLAIPAMGSMSAALSPVQTISSLVKERFFAKLKEAYADIAIEKDYIIGEYTFLAKINSLLIYILPDDLREQDAHLLKLQNEINSLGWSAFICPAEDLNFPRRMLRDIKNFKPNKNIR